MCVWKKNPNLKDNAIGVDSIKEHYRKLLNAQMQNINSEQGGDVKQELILKNRLSKLIVILLYEGVNLTMIRNSVKKDPQFKSILTQLKKYKE